MAVDLKTLNDVLYDALDSGNVNVLDEALAAGADMKDWGYEAASIALTYSSVPVLRALGNAGLEWSARLPWLQDTDEFISVVDGLLSLALFSGVTTAKIVKFLLAQGADPNRRDNGRPLLNNFLLHGANIDLAVFKALLLGAPNVNATDALGVSALICAASRDGYGRAESFALLLAAGADPRQRDAQGKSVADWAAGVPVPAYLEVLRRHGLDAKTMPAPSDSALPFSCQDLPADGYFVLAPMGKPLCLCWLGWAETVEAASHRVEQRYDWSRPPLGPFPILQRISPDGEGRLADPFAHRQAGNAVIGSLWVLTLIAFSPKDDWDNAASAPARRPIFVVSGLFPAEAQVEAQVCADRQQGWSILARLVTLTMIADGYLYPAAEMELD
jgi:hypothetical protein